MKKQLWFRKHWKGALLDVLIFGVAGVVIVAAGLIFWVSTLQIPDLSSFEERRVLQSTKIYDRTGEVLLYDLHQDVRRTIIPLEQMSRHVKNATVAIEDDQFYKHIGIDVRAIIRAAVTNFTAGDLFGGQGGSTITQQVIKNSVLQREKTLTRKIKEAILSIKLEQVLSKDEILEIYLNESPYGGTIYGVEEASRAFFNKGAADLTLAEAAYLAAIPQAPTYYSPYGNNKTALDARQKLVLERMRLNGFITAEEYEATATETVEFEAQAVSAIKAPHFVMYIREILAKKYGEEALATKGLRVITTLDWDLQKEAERIIAEKAPKNQEQFNASNAALVAVDPKVGDVLVMVGSRDYFSEEVDGNFNVALAERQPGSSIKPFIYATAFSEGYLPTTVVFDVFTQFSPSCDPGSYSSESPCYAPGNYNGKFIGPITMRNALAQSLNIPAVKTLYLAGLKDSLKLAADMGLTTLTDPDRYGLTVVLGGGEVRLLDMTHGYSVFANRGLKAEPRNILRIEDSRGTVIEEFPIMTNRVLDENVADMISDILSDDEARAPLWGRGSVINFNDRDVAGKSGSTNNFRDAWIMGYAPNLAVGAWAGNNDNEPMRGLSGLITTPFWREFMDYALAKLPEESFVQPQIATEGVKPILRGDYIDASKLFAEMQEKDQDTLDISTYYNNIHTILYYVDRNNPQGPYPSNPAVDPQYVNWEYGVQKWKEATYGPLIKQLEQTADEDENEDNDDRRRRND
ncbi:MAG: transglycosylase domain-containing protein [Patescibacteria group bacterium]